MRPPVHAPDGGTFAHALCENPTGDINDYERYVDCPECLDALDAADVGLRLRLRQHGFHFLGGQTRTKV